MPTRPPSPCSDARAVHDVLVIGAGPGGSAAATTLAAQGCDVLLVDRAAFPRPKTCGDGLTPRALNVLTSLGLAETVERLGRPIRTFTVVAPHGQVTGGAIPDPRGALVVPRLILDDTLRRHALAAGARFEDHVTVQHLERDATDGVIAHATRAGRPLRITARVAVIATGAATALLADSGILRQPPQVMLAARTYYDGVAQAGESFELRFDGVPWPGYGWVFPVSPACVNVGVGFLPVSPLGWRARLSRHRPRTAHQVFETFVRQPALQRRLIGSHQDGPVRGYPIRVDFLRAPTSADRTLLVGEAAGLVNPLTGEGIDYALESGQLAGLHAAALLADPQHAANHLLRYHHELHDRFARLFRFCELVRDLVCIPPLLDALVLLANRRPDLRRGLAEVVLGGRLPTEVDASRLLLKLGAALLRGPATHQAAASAPIQLRCR